MVLLRTTFALKIEDVRGYRKGILTYLLNYLLI